MSPETIFIRPFFTGAELVRTDRHHPGGGPSFVILEADRSPSLKVLICFQNDLAVVTCNGCSDAKQVHNLQ